MRQCLARQPRADVPGTSTTVACRIPHRVEAGACPAQIVRHCATHRRDSGRGRLQLGKCLQPRLPSPFWRAAWRDTCRRFSIATIFVWKSGGEIGAPLPAIAGETLQLDAPSRVRLPGAGSDRATNTRSIETGPFLTPRLAPTLRPSCRGVQAACAALDASSRRSVFVAATTVAFASLFAECELSVWVRGGCRHRFNGTAGLPSAPEMPCAPLQLRLVPQPDLHRRQGLRKPKRSRLGIDHFERRLCPLEIWLVDVEALRKPSVNGRDRPADPILPVSATAVRGRPQAANKPTEPASDAFSSRVDPAI